MKKIISILIIGILVISGLGVNGLSLKNLSRPSIIENYDMVIIAPDMFSDALQPLINHKNLLGIETFLKTTENIYSTYDGRDKPEQIKYCIKYMIETFEIKYVLLIGDIQKTPIRKTEVNHIWGSPENHLFYQVDDIITDLYYADIYNSNGTFSSWDSNNDNIFSEHYLYNEGETLEERVIVDEVDLYPDVGVGRIPCKTIEELDIVVHKIITYETQDNNDYFHNIILAGCDGFPEPGYQCEMITERISDVMNNFTQVKLYESMDNLNPSLINREINNGAGFFFCESHGSPYAFHDYLKSNIKKLHNKNPKNIWPCISWELLKHQEGGSIATIGHTRAGQIVRDNPPSGFSGLFSIMFFESYKPGITLSQMYNDAIISFIDDSWKNYVTLQEHIVLGDPSLKIGGYNTL
jgi:hypothetical protein